MSERPTEIPREIERESAIAVDKALLADKVVLSWRIASAELGHANVVRAAENLYYTVFEPEHVVAERGIRSDERYPERIPTLTSRLSFLRPPTLPTNEQRMAFRDEFIQTMRRALANRLDFETCLYEGALEQLEFMMDQGPVALWTAGDVVGVPDRALPGSYQQLKKVAIAGIGHLRRQRWESDSEYGQLTRGDLLRVFAAEDKFTVLPLLYAHFRERSINRLVAIEDRLENLLRVVDSAERTGFAVYPIWVREGKQKDVIPTSERRSLDELLATYHAVGHIREVQVVLSTSGFIREPGSQGFICDYDGVLSDDVERERQMCKIVVETMVERGWYGVMEGQE